MLPDDDDDDDVLGFTLSNKLFTQNAWHEGYFAINHFFDFSKEFKI